MNAIRESRPVLCPRCSTYGNPLDIEDGSHCGWTGNQIVADDFRVEPHFLGRLELLCPDPACRWSQVLDAGYHNVRWLNRMAHEHIEEGHREGRWG